MKILSYPLSVQTPAYGNGDKPVIRKNKEISKGDSCNTLDLTFSNHAGTHLDCPYHFDDQGKKLTDYPAEFWFCHEVQILDCTLSAGELLGCEQLEQALKKSGDLNQQAEAVLLRTGWSEKRMEVDYWQNPPGFLPEIKQWLRKNFPKIRFFGFDIISLSSFAHRDIGREAHRAFLCEDPILVIEDMNLAQLKDIEPLKNLLVSPLLIENADGAPCSVWGNL